MGVMSKGALFVRQLTYGLSMGLGCSNMDVLSVWRIVLIVTGV